MIKVFGFGEDRKTLGRGVEQLEEQWSIRIGAKAASAVLPNRFRFWVYLATFLIFLIFFGMVIVLAARGGKPPAWLLDAVFSSLAIFWVSGLTCRILDWRQGSRAARLATEYLGVCILGANGRVPHFAMQSPRVFDGYLVMFNIPRVSSYKLLAGPEAYLRAKAYQAKPKKNVLLGPLIYLASELED